MMDTYLKQAFAPLEPLFHFVSHTTLFGFVPLDIVAHILVGYIVTKALLSFGLGLPKTLLVLFILELTKEIYDSSTLSNTLEENLKDIAFTFLYPAWVILKRVRQRKKAQNKRP